MVIPILLKYLRLLIISLIKGGVSVTRGNLNAVYSSNLFFLLWGYADYKYLTDSICYIMKESNGGITLEYIENYLEPWERENYFYTYAMAEKDRIKRENKK